MKPLTLIVRTAGTNCDRETAFAFELAGANVESVHINSLLRDPTQLKRFQILAFPGGFSYGDDIAAGRILANQIVHHLAQPMREFIGAGKPIIGICNGFQVLVKTDLLPGDAAGASGQTATLAHNDNGRFTARWVHLAAPPSRCIWTRGLQQLQLPIAHGEGKFVCADLQRLEWMQNSQQVALIYAKPDGSPAAGQTPDNPNGSAADIAGVCDPSGLVFGLMPHPERFVDSTQHPAWTRQTKAQGEPMGLAIFKNAVSHLR